MKTSSTYLLTLLFVALLGTSLASYSQQDEPQSEARNVSGFGYYTRYEIAGDLFQVRQDLESILDTRGLTVSDIRDIEIPGITNASPPLLVGEYLSFCGPPITGVWLVGELHNVVLCPVTVAIYVLPRQSATVHISYRSLKAHGGPVKAQYATEDMERLLHDVIVELVGE